MGAKLSKLHFEGVEIIGPHETRKPAESMAHRAVAVETVEQDPNAARLCGFEHCAVEKEIGRRVRLVEMPEHALDVAKGAGLIAANEMRLDPTGSNHSLDEMPLV